MAYLPAAIYEIAHVHWRHKWKIAFPHLYIICCVAGERICGIHAYASEKRVTRSWGHVGIFPFYNVAADDGLICMDIPECGSVVKQARQTALEFAASPFNMEFGSLGGKNLPPGISEGGSPRRHSRDVSILRRWQTQSLKKGVPWALDMQWSHGTTFKEAIETSIDSTLGYSDGPNFSRGNMTH